MKVYVDELPKSCDKCDFCEHFDKDAHGKGKHEVACYFAGSIGNILYGNQISPKTCPLQSLADHDKQVRKEVCDDIKNKIEQAKLIYEWKSKEITIEDVLDRIQGE